MSIYNFCYLFMASEKNLLWRHWTDNRATCFPFAFTRVRNVPTLCFKEKEARKVRTRRTNQPQRALRDRLAWLLARAEDHRIRKVRHARRVRIRPRALLHRGLDASALEGLHRHRRPRGSAYV